jgi:hypothetical protein
MSHQHTDKDLLYNNISKAKRGRIKLMLKLPAIRSHLIRLIGDPIDDLAEAYDEATEMLDELRRNNAKYVVLLKEYKTICSDIEHDVVKYCHSTKR